MLIYSADADASLAVPATLAGADGLANKAAPADELLEAIRIVAKGTPLFPPISPDMIEGVASRLPWGEQMVFELLMERMPDGEIAARLGLEAQDVAERVRLDARAPAGVARDVTLQASAITSPQNAAASSPGQAPRVQVRDGGQRSAAAEERDRKLRLEAPRTSHRPGERLGGVLEGGGEERIGVHRGGARSPPGRLSLASGPPCRGVFP
ncbi:MAG: hypothetical protein WKF31_05280 [Thermoleophilaceae bacterium]